MQTQSLKIRGSQLPHLHSILAERARGSRTLSKGKSPGLIPGGPPTGDDADMSNDKEYSSPSIYENIELFNLRSLSNPYICGNSDEYSWLFVVSLEITLTVSKSR